MTTVWSRTYAGAHPDHCLEYSFFKQGKFWMLSVS